MSKIEKSVQELAIALEDLSVRVEKSVLASTEKAESLVATRSHARAAQQHAGKASRELATAITDLKKILAASDDTQAEPDLPTGGE